jgi:predicted transcriptional regulator
MSQLQQLGMIRKAKGDQKKGFYYEVVSLEEYEKLKEGVSGALDQMLENLKQAVQSSKAVQSPNEPLPKSSSKGKRKQFTKTIKG